MRTGTIVTAVADLMDGMHHTGLVVADLDAMVAFYTQQLGFEVRHELDSVAPASGDHTGVPGARRKLVFLGIPGQEHQLELVHYVAPPAAPGHLDKHQLGAMHVCFTVDDIQSTYQQLQRQGVRFVSEPKWQQDAEKGRVGVVYTQDPEDNWLEFIQWGG